MAVVEKDELWEEVFKKYKLAKDSIDNLLEKSASPKVSDRIPNYKAGTMEFGTYNSDQFVVLFADMRNSTDRSEKIGSKDTFLTIHAIMPALIYIVEAYGGYVIDLPGDGIMALFKENRKNIYWVKDGNNLNDEELGYKTGFTILEMIDEVVNPILNKDGILSVEFGVGVASGNCIVTKVGTDGTYDTKAIGNSINQASKKSDGFREMKISPQIYNSLSEFVGHSMINSVDGWFSYTYSRS